MKNVLAGFLGGCFAIGAVVLYMYVERYWLREATNFEFSDTFVKHELRELTIKVESYKLIFGHYPDSLEAARGGFGARDAGATGCDCPGDYYYELVGEARGYLLLSKGSDCRALTHDDVFPDFTPEELSAIGYRLPSDEYVSENEPPCHDA